MTSIGITCNPSTAWIAVARDGQIQDCDPKHLELPEAESSEALSAFLEEATAAFAALKPGRIAVLRAEGFRRGKPNLNQVTTRAALETLIRVAAVRAGAAVEYLDRATARARLDVKGGGLEDHLDDVIPVEVGGYWRRDRRGLAAMAAVAAELA